MTPELFAASARPPTLIGAVAVPTFLRRETRWTGPVPKSFASVHGKPPLQFEGEPVWAEFIVLRLLARAGWQGVWVKNWKGQAFWRDVMDPVELPADQAALFARIAQNSRDMRLETRKAAMGRWGGGWLGRLRLARRGGPVRREQAAQAGLRARDPADLVGQCARRGGQRFRDHRIEGRLSTPSDAVTNPKPGTGQPVCGGFQPARETPTPSLGCSPISATP